MMKEVQGQSLPQRIRGKTAGSCGAIVDVPAGAMPLPSRTAGRASPRRSSNVMVGEYGEVRRGSNARSSVRLQDYEELVKELSSTHSLFEKAR